VGDDQAKSGGGAAVVIVVVLLLLALPCIAGVFLLAGFAVFRVQAPAPMPLPPVPGANAPLPGDMMVPIGGSVTVNQMTWSQNLFDAADEILTPEKYDQIKPGMTYDEVIATLGIPEDRRPPDIDLVTPESDVELKWFGGENDAKSITVKLKGKVVVDKAQSGLM
jgi:hypothetical protein